MGLFRKRLSVEQRTDLVMGTIQSFIDGEPAIPDALFDEIKHNPGEVLGVVLSLGNAIANDHLTGPVQAEVEAQMRELQAERAGTKAEKAGRILPAMVFGQPDLEKNVAYLNNAPEWVGLSRREQDELVVALLHVSARVLPKTALKLQFDGGSFRGFGVDLHQDTEQP